MLLSRRFRLSWLMGMVLRVGISRLDRRSTHSLPQNQQFPEKSAYLINSCAYSDL